MHDVAAANAASGPMVASTNALGPDPERRAQRRGRATLSDLVVPASLLLFAAVWLAHLAFTSLSPPTDDIEQLTWVRSLEWGYYKHPPLPTWLIWLPVRLFGLSNWTAYALGASLTLTALALYWRLLVRLRGPTYAGVALMAAMCITYYNGRLNYYNHNIVLLLVSTACAALTWQAFTTRRLRWWVALGLAIGLGALAKYQIAVTIVSILAFATHQRAWRDPSHRRGAWTAALVALIVFAPHLAWLQSHDFAPIQYAVESSLGAHFGPATRASASVHWLIDQVFNRALPALLLLAMAASPFNRSTTRPQDGRDAMPSVESGAARALLLAWGLVPLIFMPLVGVLLGADLQLQWGTPFLLFAVPALMELTPSRNWRRINLQGAAITFMVLQVLLLTLSHLASPRGPAWAQDRHWRTFDSLQLAELVGMPARNALQGPIRIVIGSASVAGALSLRLVEHPLVLIDNRFDRSPWVPRELLQQCGALEIGDIETLAQGQPIGPAFPHLAWRVIRPDASAASCPA